MIVLQSLLCGLFMLIVIIYAIFLYNQRRLYELARKIPGLNGVPILGSLYSFLVEHYSEYLEVLLKLNNSSEKIWRIWVGPKVGLFINSPASLQIVLNSPHCMKKPSFFYDTYYVNHGIVLANGDQWKHHRKTLSPAFSMNVIQKLLPIFDDKSQISVKVLEKQLNKGEFNIYDTAAACSLESLLRGTMNYDVDCQSNPHDDYILNIIEKNRAALMKRLFRVWYNYEPLYKLSNLYKELIEGAVEKLFGLSHKIIQQNQKMIQEVSESGDDSGKNQIFIDKLIDPKNSFTEKEMLHEIVTFIIAGHETSACTISVALMMLAMHKDIQDKVFNEIDNVIGSYDGLLDIETLNKLTYLDLVIKESLRLFPVLPAVLREATADVEAEGQTIPEGSILFIFPFDVHRNPKYWGSDAHLFKPERFEPENIKDIHPYAFIPFISGSRVCLGWRYAMYFMKSYLVRFLKTYSVDTKLKLEELKPEIAPSLSIKQGFMISINKRE